MLQPAPCQPHLPESLDLTDTDYEALAEFRHTMRGFLHFSEAAANNVGLMPQQHQALLAIRAARGRQISVGELADRLLLRPHSVTGLVDRLVRLGLIVRQPSEADRRRVVLGLTKNAETTLAKLTLAHRTELLRIRPVLAGLLEQIAFLNSP